MVSPIERRPITKCLKVNYYIVTKFTLKFLILKLIEADYLKLNLLFFQTFKIVSRKFYFTSKKFVFDKSHRKLIGDNTLGLYRNKPCTVIGKMILAGETILNLLCFNHFPKTFHQQANKISQPSVFYNPYLWCAVNREMFYSLLANKRHLQQFFNHLVITPAHVTVYMFIFR